MADFEKQRLEDNIKACMIIPRTVLEREPGLIATTWFEYQFMSPWERTKLFESCYALARQKALSMRIGTSKAEARKLYSVGWNMQNRELTKLWKARQRADELCLPYGVICDKAFGFTELANRKNICLPEQLIPDWYAEGQEEFKAFWSQQMFDDIDESRWIMFNKLADKLAPFRREFGTDLTAQKSLHKYLLEVRDRKQLPFESFFNRFALYERLIGNKALEELVNQRAKLVAHHEGSVADQVIETRSSFKLAADTWVKSGRPNEAPKSAADKVCILQGCHGLMQNFKGRSECATCPQFTACEALSNACEITTCGKIGGMDPTALRRRQSATERKKKSRRNAAAIASTHPTATAIPNIKIVNAK